MNQQNNFSEEKVYATPFNVDLSLPHSKSFFDEYLEKALSVPESIKNILMATSSAEFIENNLGPNFSMNSKQITEITRLIRDILISELFLGDFPMLISKKLNVDMQTADQMARKIATELFAPAIEDIKEFQKQKFVSKTGQFQQPEKQHLSSFYQNKPDLKINPEINPNNVIDLRNK